MYICEYVYMHFCIHRYMHIWFVHVHMRLHVYVDMCRFIDVYMYVGIHLSI